MLGSRQGCCGVRSFTPIARQGVRLPRSPRTLSDAPPATAAAASPADRGSQTSSSTSIAYASSSGVDGTPRGNTSQRRDLLLGATLLAALCVCAAPAQAVEPSNPIVKYWLGRQRGNFRKLLAPIQASQARLRTAQALLAVPGAPADVAPVLQLVRLSSLNCYAFEPNDGDSLEARTSMMVQSMRISDPCTFGIIIRSITDLSPPDVRARGAVLLDDTIRAYQKLDSYLELAVEGQPQAFQKAEQQLGATSDVLRRVEQFVQEVLLVTV